MSKEKKKQEAAPEAAKTAAMAEIHKTQEQMVEELRKQIREEEREKAMAEALQQLGIDPDKVEKESAEAKAHNKRINEPRGYDLGSIVINLNGTEYTGSGEAPAHVVECLMEIAGKRQRRILNEALGQQYQVEQVAGMGFRSRLVGAAPADRTK